MKTKILGVDPGLNFTGWGVIEYTNANDFNYIASGLIKTSGLKNYIKKLYKIYQEIDSIAKLYSPNEASIENTYVNSNNKSSLILSQARAASIIGISNNKLDVSEYSAKTIKKTVTGFGNAEKSQIIKAIKYFVKNISIKYTDEADAIAIALCHASHKKTIQ